MYTVMLVTTILHCSVHVQIKAFQDDSGTTLPSLVTVPGNESISLVRLVAFTDARFLRTVTQAGAVLASEDAEGHAAACMFAIMQGRAPPSLSIAQLADLLRICNFAMAHSLAGGFPAYLKPLLDSASPEVRALKLDVLLPFCLHAMAAKCGNLAKIRIKRQTALVMILILSAI